MAKTRPVGAGKKAIRADFWGQNGAFLRVFCGCGAGAVAASKTSLKAAAALGFGGFYGLVLILAQPGCTPVDAEIHPIVSNCFKSLTPVGPVHPGKKTRGG